MACMDLHYVFLVHTVYMHIIYSGFFFFFLLILFFSVFLFHLILKRFLFDLQNVYHYHDRNKNNPIHHSFPPL